MFRKMRGWEWCALAALAAGALAGSAEAAIEISSIEELQKIGNRPDYPLDGDYILTQDIDVSETAEWNRGEGFIPIGSPENPFVGALDGQGHVITGLNINRPGEYDVGLLGYVGESGAVENLGLEHCDVTGNASVGSLVGLNQGAVTECYATGDVTGETWSVGGLVGYNNGGAVSQSHAECDVIGEGPYMEGGFVGGLVGLNESGTVKDSHTSGEVSGGEAVGGLIGKSSGSDVEISHSSSTAEVVGHRSAGGLVGHNEKGLMDDSHATGDVTVVGVSLTPSGGPHGLTGNNVGGLVGTNSGEISRSHATGNVVASGSSAGGLVGSNSGYSVSQSYATGNVVASGSSAGGLVGSNNGDIVSESYATGSVEAEYAAGGLAGDSGSRAPGSDRNEAQIFASYATGAVEAERRAGGLVGISRRSGVVRDSYAVGPVSGQEESGGLVGHNSGLVRDSYAAGPVSGQEDVGGLVGHNSGLVRDSYAAGPVSGQENVGGLVGQYSYGGRENGVVRTSFWDVDATGISANGGELGLGLGLPTGEMTARSTYQQAGWSPAIWTMAEGEYPRLAWEDGDGEPLSDPEPLPMAGSGSSSDPYEIATKQHLALLGKRGDVLDAHMVLTSDVDLEGEPLEPISALGPFTGHFEGHGHVIRNAVIDKSLNPFGGLFPIIGKDGEVRNLRLEDVTIAGGRDTGGLAGWNQGSVTECFVSGSVAGGGDTGGLAGWNQGSVTECFVSGSVTGTDDAGGLVGRNSGEVSTSGSAAAVSGEDRVGGLIGENEKAVWESHATGSVDGVKQIGGLVGANTGSGSVRDSYAQGSVSGESTVGGLAGYNIGTVERCYAAGAIQSENSAGGLVASNIGPPPVTYPAPRPEGTVTGSFWNMETTGQDSTSGDGEGRSTAAMQTESTYTDADWDFDETWHIEEGVSYPELRRGPTPEPELVINEVWHDPAPGSDSPVQMTILGNGFEPGATVVWRNETTGERRFEQTPASLTPIEITVDPVFGEEEAEWSVQVVNPSGEETEPYTITVLPAAKGMLEVVIEPEFVRWEGAQWRVDGGEWRDSGETMELLFGDYTVEFKPMEGLEVPNQRVAVKAGETVTVVGRYEGDMGSLRVLLEPREAVDAGAAWKPVMDDAPTFQGHHTIHLYSGEYKVEFIAPDGWVAPEAQTVTVIKWGLHHVKAEFQRAGMELVELERDWGLSLGGTVLGAVGAAHSLYVGDEVAFPAGEREDGLVEIQAPSQSPGAHDIRVLNRDSGEEHIIEDGVTYTANPFAENLDRSPRGMRLIEDTPTDVSTAAGYLPLEDGELRGLEYETPEGIVVEVPVEALPENATDAFVVLRSAEQVDHIFEEAVAIPNEETPRSPYVDIHILVERDHSGEDEELVETVEAPVLLRFPHTLAPEAWDELGVGLMVTNLDEQFQPLLPEDPEILRASELAVTFDDEDRAVVEAEHLTAYGLLGPEVPGDVTGNGVVTAEDLQLVINKVLGMPINPDYNPDVTRTGEVNAQDIQKVINAVLGIE